MREAVELWFNHYEYARDRKSDARKQNLETAQATMYSLHTAVREKASGPQYDMNQVN